MWVSRGKRPRNYIPRHLDQGRSPEIASCSNLSPRIVQESFCGELYKYGLWPNSNLYPVMLRKLPEEIIQCELDTRYCVTALDLLLS